MLTSVLGVVAAACGDDGNNGQLPDGPAQTVDARVVDTAPEIDAAPDAPPPAATVRVTLGGVPARDQTVYFQSHDSATTVTVLTDADGVATSAVQAGDFVTVVDPLAPETRAIGLRAHLSTFAAVQPGDHLFVDVPVIAAQGASVQFTINVPNEQLGYDYVLYSTCGAAPIGRGNSPARAKRPAGGRKGAAVVVAPVTASVKLFGCGGTADLLVVGADGEGGVHSWQYQPGVGLTEGGTVDFASYESVVDQAYSYTAPPGTQRVELTRELRTARGSLYSSLKASVSFDGTAGSTTVAMPTPPGVVAITTSTVEPAQGFSRANYIEWGGNTAYALDIPTTALHAYSDVPVVDVAAHAVTWTQVVDGQTPQLTIASIQVARTDDNGPHTWTWDLVAPWSEGSVAYPVLPTTLFDFNPAVSDQPLVLRLTTARVPGGYDAARPRVFAGDLAGGVAGESGQVVFEDVFVNVATLGKRTAPRGLRRGGFTPPAR